MQVRLPLALLGLFAAFGGGAASSHLLEREAGAQTAHSAMVYLPAEGLTFKTLDGHLVARLSYDSRGGAFEVYDNRERPAGALRAGLLAEAPHLSSTAPVTTGATFANPADVDLGY
jgi:hypothetical protein